MNNDKYFNQTLSEMVENLINCNAYQTLQFIDSYKFNQLMIDLISNIATTFYISSITFNAVPLHRIRYFGTVYLTIYGDVYCIQYINSKKIKVTKD